MSRTFQSPVATNFYPTAIIADCVDWSEEAILRKTDTPNEYVWIMPSKIDTPARLSIKFEEVKDVYRAGNVNPASRMDDTSGVRISVAYSEVGEETDDQDSSYRKLAPLSMTTNMTIPHASSMDDQDIVKFVARAIGAWLGLDKDVTADSEMATYGADVLRRVLGSLKPAQIVG